MFHVQVINLDRCQDRWREIETWDHGFTDFNRFSAIDAKKLDYLNRDDISVRTKLFIQGKVKRSFHDIDVIGAIGCSLSYYTILSNFMQDPSKGEYLLILEDDLDLSRFKQRLLHDKHREDRESNNDSMEYKTYAQEIEEELAKLPSTDWDIWILGKHTTIAGIAMAHDVEPWQENSTPEAQASLTLKMPINTSDGVESSCEYTNVKQFLGSQAIVYKRSAIPKILASFLPIEVHYDSYLSFLAQLGKIRIIHKPSFNLAQNMSFGSTINHTDLSVALLNQTDWWYKIFFYIVITLILLYFILRLITTTLFQYINTLPSWNPFISTFKT